MSVEGLHRDLLAIPGVADASVEGEAAAPTGVRVRLALAADPAAVGSAVQRLLESRGMRSRVAAVDSDTVPAPVLAAAPDSEERPVLVVTPETPDDGAASDPAVRPDAIAGLATLTIEESADAVLVIATSTAGSRFSRRTVIVDEAGVAAAVVAVVGAMVEGRPPRLLAVTHSHADGTEVVTVVLERRDGARVAGAAAVSSGRPYAVARATWAALRS
jgi:hypothetical protein